MTESDRTHDWRGGSLEAPDPPGRPEPAAKQIRWEGALCRNRGMRSRRIVQPASSAAAVRRAIPPSQASRLGGHRWRPVVVAVRTSLASQMRGRLGQGSRRGTARGVPRVGAATAGGSGPGGRPSPASRDRCRAPRGGRPTGQLLAGRPRSFRPCSGARRRGQESAGVRHQHCDRPRHDALVRTPDARGVESSRVGRLPICAGRALPFCAHRTPLGIPTARRPRRAMQAATEGRGHVDRRPMAASRPLTGVLHLAASSDGTRETCLSLRRRSFPCERSVLGWPL